MNLLLIAMPGAGKGVVSNYLIEKYNFTHLSAGDLIRNEIKSILLQTGIPRYTLPSVSNG